MSHQLDGVRLRLARAEEHLIDLEARARAFATSTPNPYTTSVHLDQETGDFRITLDRADQPPPEWGVVVGEILYNLR